MIGESTTEYLFIRICILFLHNIAPISILYSTQLLLVQFVHLPNYLEHLPYPIQIWLTTEAIFLITFIIPLKYNLHHSTICHRPLSAEGREKLFRRCIASVPNLEKYLSRWLLVSEAEYIKRDNVKDFVRWAFFRPDYKHKWDQHDEVEVEAYTTEIEKLIGQKLAPGRIDLKGLGQLLHETTGSHRSLLWYTCVFVVDTVTYCKMLYNGFHFHRSSLSRFFNIFPIRPLTLFTAYQSPAQHLTYWHRQHTSTKRLPVLFIHGIGVGLYPYMNFLQELNSELETGANNDGEVGIIALEIMPISSRITHPALERHVMIREILQIVQYHRWSRFVLVSHSYGSIIAAHLLKSDLFDTLIGPMVFIDPVAFLLHLPDVTYNFTVRQPARANEYLLWYFGSKDIGVAHTLSRRFSWIDNIIWRENLRIKGEKNQEGRNVTVALSGKDAIVATETVAQYLVGSLSDRPSTRGWKNKSWIGYGLELLWYEQLDHAQIFSFKDTRWPVIRAISVYSGAG
ncbi:uncharacterized protein APUU_40026S [Aspergillus puulaauensis]|uniref:AB hydrolase-1 domain-containing protein n=1 Tax=Aspergillus puulaauensis TaxID=1220207 RepID=A0A7R7XLW3_9EURO|nr:uncharacterized protein APUU_40026S [Aspergillus puulaauensis]BCS23582.1 hypothetical protein APUU_40026S [Aspergillus puulaauensis]